MYGPLVMTASGIESWDEASVTVASDLSDIEPLGAGSGKGYEANVYALRFHGMEFLPDYYTDHNTAHYLRLEIQGDPSADLKRSLSESILAAGAYPAEHYTAESFAALQEAVDAGRELLAQSAVTEPQAEERIHSLAAAVAALEATGLDRTPLTKALAEVGDIPLESYTDASCENLRKVAGDAERVAASSSSQAEIDRQAYQLRQAAAALDAAAEVDKSALGELMQIAAARKRAQQTWLALEVKVPEFAPWAPYGYARLEEQYARAEAAYGNAGRRYSQGEVDKIAADLNAAINTMRPGNLAELEDLGNLLRAVENAEAEADSESKRDAIEYARMVIKYVSDGSGTMEMIRDAEVKLASAAGK